MAGGEPASERRSVCWLLLLQFILSPSFYKEKTVLASTRCEGCVSPQPLAVPMRKPASGSWVRSREETQRGHTDGKHCSRSFELQNIRV